MNNDHDQSKLEEPSVPVHPYPLVLLGAYLFVFLLFAGAAGFFLYGLLLTRSLSTLGLVMIFGVPASMVAEQMVRYWKRWRQSRDSGVPGE